MPPGHYLSYSLHKEIRGINIRGIFNSLTMSSTEKLMDGTMCLTWYVQTLNTNNNIIKKYSDVL